MSIDSFPALVARSDNGALHVALDTVDSSLLAEGDVLVRVSYSSLNYKDALGVSGKEKIFRTYPIIPGIDYAGTVEHSESDNFKSGDSVLLTGWGVGEKHSGGSIRPCAGQIFVAFAARHECQKSHVVRHRRVNGGFVCERIDR